MGRSRNVVLVGGALAFGALALIVMRPAPAEAPAAAEVEVDSIREPAVAGAFYPAGKAELREMVDGYLAQAKGERIVGLRALVCPHAGYVYSGLTAAHCYAPIAGMDFQTVVVLAPSHRHRFDGVSIPAVDAYRTPLGLVLLSPAVKQYRGRSPFVSVARAHAREHSLEVQLPFIQRTLRSPRLVPMVFGRVAPEDVARALAAGIDEKTLVVASTDLSHHHPYETAQQLDRQTVDAILALDLDQMRGGHACGKGPVLALMELARQRGWRAKLLDYRNSGDTAGNKGSVVGYSAIAFYSPIPLGQTQG
jgi:AmmeMemoRadiSam system protein B